MDGFDILAQCDGFEWDAHNSEKNWRSHKVSAAECEQVFFNRPIVSGEDIGHSGKEKRFYILGRTDAGRMLFVVFTVRSNQARVISAKDMNRKEIKIYESFHDE
jgi:uncharacterized protein